jgi:outer membrane protein
MRISGFLVALLLVGVAFPLSAQPTVLTLDDVTRIALQQNIDILQAQNNVDAVSSQLTAAYGNYLPTVSASGGWSRSQSGRSGGQTQIIEGIPVVTPESVTLQNSFNAGANASLPIFDGLAREATLSNTQSRMNAAEQNSTRVKQAIVYQVSSSYLNILRNRELVRVSEENLRRDQRQLERIEESNRVGALSIADVYRQQSQVANDELNLIQAQNNYAKSKADLVAILSLDPALEYDFVDPSVRTQMDSTEVKATLQKYSDIRMVIMTALENRPDYKATLENYNAAEANVTGASSSYWPSLSASASYGMFSNKLKTLSVNDYNLSWGVSVRWLLFDGFGREQQVQNAKVSSRNAELNLIQAEKVIAVEVKKALLDLDAARKAWEVSEKALISAEQDRRIAEERYNLGGGTLLDLLVANANYVGAEANRVNSIAGFLISKYNTEFVLGVRSF